MAKVRIEGVDGLRRALRRLVVDVSADAAAGVREAGEAVREDIRDNMAVDTGAARSAVQDRYRDGGLTAEVGVFDAAVASYVQYPEHGTSSQPAQPSMLPAAERERLRLARRIADRIRRRYR